MLADFPLVERLEQSDRDILERVLVIETRRRGEVLVREGEQASAGQSALFLILDGTVRVSCEAPEGGFGVDRIVGAGELIGLVALVDDSARSATCTVDSEARIGKLTRRVLDQLYKTNSHVHARFQYMVARQLASDLRSLDARLQQAFRDGADQAPL